MGGEQMSELFVYLSSLGEQFFFCCRRVLFVESIPFAPDRTQVHLRIGSLGDPSKGLTFEVLGF